MFVEVMTTDGRNDRVGQIGSGWMLQPELELELGRRRPAAAVVTRSSPATTI